MAAQGAHLTSTASEEGETPSIFEVLAQESLLQALRPALQYVLRVIAENNPARYGRLYAHSEEVYLGLQLILENYYLKHYSASFSENFYGLKRVCVSSGQGDEEETDADAADVDSDTESQTSAASSLPSQSSLYNRLPLSNRLRSMAFLVLVPYIKAKCDKWYEILKESHQHSHEGQSAHMKLKQKLCRAFLGIYPVFHFVWESTMLACQLAFVFDKSPVHTPLLKWAGVILLNLTEGDMTGHVMNKPLNFKDKSWMQSLHLLANKFLGGLAITLSSGLSVGVFFLQFLEWWYASDQKATTLTALPNPHPPQPLTEVSVPKLHTICPLCQKVRVNDTALAVSGYVFCYTCISSYISENSCCPITRYPASEDHLVRLYLPDG